MVGKKGKSLLWKSGLADTIQQAKIYGARCRVRLWAPSSYKLKPNISLSPSRRVMKGTGSDLGCLAVGKSASLHTLPEPYYSIPDLNINLETTCSSVSLHLKVKRSMFRELIMTRNNRFTGLLVSICASKISQYPLLGAIKVSSASKHSSIRSPSAALP